jgi:hypothetical protein
MTNELPEGAVGLPPYYRLGNTDQQRDHAVGVVTGKFYDLVMADPELLQYFAAVLLRGNVRDRDLVGPGLDRQRLEEHVAQTVAVALGRPPRADDEHFELTDHLIKFNISPRHYWKTGAYLDTALDEVGVPLDIIGTVRELWTALAPQIVRRYARQVQAGAL